MEGWTLVLMASVLTKLQLPKYDINDEYSYRWSTFSQFLLIKSKFDFVVLLTFYSIVLHDSKLDFYSRKLLLKCNKKETFPTDFV